MSENALRGETSPYLLQHKDNPVHWRPWGEAAFAEAKAGNKPVLLSVGYAACHWCHVMAHESFEDDAIAKLMNAHFVSIKVDREERPDLDAVYQAALHAMGEQGGWPLTMFLTPDGAPFWGGTYFPPESRWGRPGFPDVLGAMARIWREEPDKIAHNAAALKEALADLARPGGGGGTLALESLDRAASLALRLVDLEQGGTRGAPKFPQAPLFRFLWRAHLRSRAEPRVSDQIGRAVLTTLDRICQGGIYDHLGGGLARYSTDEVWLAPHFEKMLYDNAMLIELLAEAWTETKSPLYAARARETVAWLLAEMKTGGKGDGKPFGLASAFDADSEGEEGKFYVWSEAEVDTVLGADSAFFKKIYDVTAAGNWEGHTILRRDPTAGLLAEADEERLASLRERLLAERKKRVPPGRDDKVLADWNGLAVAALASAGSVFGEAAWIEAAKNVFAFAAGELIGDDGRPRHSWREGRARHPATLEDLAQLSRAALALHEATEEGGYLEAAEKYAGIADAHYRDADGGYFLSASDVTDVIQRAKPLFDNATPSGNGGMAEVLARLYHLTGKDAYRARAEALFRALAPARIEMLINMPGFACAFEYLERPTMIVVAGAPGAHATAELLAAAFALPAPAKIIQRVADGTKLPPAHPAFGKGPVGGRPAAYVCVGTTCGLPVTDPGALSKALAGR
ncbi:MAG: thioredoxin domain-containing protein [Rhodospirillales bacterium]|nr:thioredoxin domain-containing protein [Rhodospirillales bacterium]